MSDRVGPLIEMVENLAEEEAYWATLKHGNEVPLPPKWNRIFGFWARSMNDRAHCCTPRTGRG